MDSHVERIEHQENLPLRVFVHSVRSCASHRHRDCEFLLVLRGELVVSTAAGERVLGPDELFFFHGQEPHLTRGSGSTNLVAALQIDTERATRLDPDFTRRRFAINELARSHREDPRLRILRSIMAECLWEMRLRRPAYRLQVESHVLRLLALLVREIPHRLSVAPKVTPEAGEEDALGQRLARIVAAMEAHSSEELSSADIAASEQVSPSYLARLFKERLGTTFSDHLNQIRARKALPRLAGGEAGILEIALDCGFPSLKRFNEVFRELHHCTPSEWRRRHAGAPVPGIGESAYNPADLGLGYHLLRKHLPPGSPLLET
jgi:xylan 1,4-beta-xylosidase